MNLLLRIFILLCVLLSCQSLIIPEELPSILSLIYSNIPPIKKGTDSRIGFGFRLGEHADFQVLLELGPQTNTRPLANQGNSGSQKRHTQKLTNKDVQKLQLLQKLNEPTPVKISDTDGGKWLANWYLGMKKKPQAQKEEPYEGLGEIKASDVIPDDSDINNSDTEINSTEDVETISSKENANSTNEETVEKQLNETDLSNVTITEQ